MLLPLYFLIIPYEVDDRWNREQFCRYAITIELKNDPVARLPSLPHAWVVNLWHQTTQCNRWLPMLNMLFAWGTQLRPWPLARNSCQHT